MPKIGAHISHAGSISKSFSKALDIGAECTQIFITPPQQWAHKSYSEYDIEVYRKVQSDTNIKPNFIHSAYLINLASTNPSILEKSIKWLIYSQDTASKLGVEGTIFHIGSSGILGRQEGLNQAVRSISKILTDSTDNKLIIETSAGAGNTIGDELFEVGFIVKSIKDKRIKVAIDTQHIFASGYDIRTDEGLEKVLDDFDREVGLEKLAVIHANDSKTALGSNKDRHENIGQGKMGMESFINILNHPSLKQLPFIIETPGFNRLGPDKENINILKSLIK